VAACFRILQSFQVHANRQGIYHELADAATKADAFWSEAEASYKSHYNSPSVPFPFIMTCLVIAASFVVEPSHNYSRISPEPFGMPYDGGDNNDGITVIDVTQLESLRYCFVFLNQSELGSRRDTPLSERQYLAEYERIPGRNDPGRNDPGRNDPGRLAAFGVLHMDCLKSAWPRGYWADHGYVQKRCPRPLRL